MIEKRMTLVNSVIFAVLMISLILFVYRFNIPNPNMILIAALVIATSVGGIIPGILCAILMLGYSLFFFSNGHDFVHFNSINAQKMTVVLLGALINLVSVSFLKKSRDKMGDQFKKTNEELLKTNHELQRTNDELHRVNELLKVLVSKDPLTNLRNRHALSEDMETFVGKPVQVLFLDLDDFKTMNDTKGHAYGDEVLHKVGQSMAKSFPSAHCYRYGGDEFLVVGDRQQDDLFLHACENVKKELVSSQISFSGGYVAGIASNKKDVQNMILQADEMLYQAKNMGKDRFVGKEFDRKHIVNNDLLAMNRRTLANAH